MAILYRQVLRHICHGLGPQSSGTSGLRHDPVPIAPDLPSDPRKAGDELTAATTPIVGQLQDHGDHY